MADGIKGRDIKSGSGFPCPRQTSSKKRNVRIGDARLLLAKLSGDYLAPNTSPSPNKLVALDDGPLTSCWTVHSQAQISDGLSALLTDPLSSPCSSNSSRGKK